MNSPDKPLILIIGNYSSSNRGDAAILDGLLNMLGKLYPDAEFRLSSWYPETASHFHHLPATEPIVRTRWRPLTTRVREIIKLLLFFFCPTPLLVRLIGNSTINCWYQSAAMVVVVGGGYLHAPYLNELWGRMAEIMYAIRLQKPTYIIGQSLGPFGDGLQHYMSKWVLDRCTHIFPREAISSNRLKNMNVTAPQTIIADTALALCADDFPNNGQQLIDSEGIELSSDRKTISVSVRHWGGDLRKNRNFQAALANGLDQLVEDGAQIMFIANCTDYGGYHNDDRLTSFHVWRHMKSRNHAHLLVEEYSPYEIGAILKTVDLHVGLRLHSCIMALDVGTPCVAIEYEAKTSGTMALAGLEEYVLHMNNFDADSLYQKATQALSNREKLNKIILDKTSALREDLLKTMRSTLGHEKL